MRGVRIVLPHRTTEIPSACRLGRGQLGNRCRGYIYRRGDSISGRRSICDRRHIGRCRLHIDRRRIGLAGCRTNNRPSQPEEQQRCHPTGITVVAVVMSAVMPAAVRAITARAICQSRLADQRDAEQGQDTGYSNFLHGASHNGARSRMVDNLPRYPGRWWAWHLHKSPNPSPMGGLH